MLVDMKYATKKNEKTANGAPSGLGTYSCPAYLKVAENIEPVEPAVR